MYGSSRPPRIPSKFPESVHKRLNAYALAAGAAGVGVLALANSAAIQVTALVSNHASHRRVVH